MSAAPHDLRVEHLDHPLGIGDRAPRVSWKLPDGATQQLAYRIVAGEWDSGRVDSPESVLVPTGADVASRRRVEWRVQVWTDLGESPWSVESWWEHGLLGPADWTARWIEPVEAPNGPDRQRPAQYLTRSIDVPGPVARARLYATAHGVYEPFLNGARVGDSELTPGFTSYRVHTNVQTFDVTEHLQVGENVLGAILTDGWWRGQHGFARTPDSYGPTTALLAQLEIDLADGTRLVFGTDAEWHNTTGAITAADLIAGERHDLTAMNDDWARPGADRSSWQRIRVTDELITGLDTSPSPPVRRIEELRPESVVELAPSRHLVDFGQNSNGWIRLRDLGPAGTTITISHGEALDADGDLTTDHLGGTGLDGKQITAGQVDVVVSRGVSGDVFEPRHSTKGFRYVRVEGHPGPIAPDAITSVVVHTDVRPIGGFTCSDDRLNALHDAAVWSFRGNACDIPTDCPQRERSGWTGDWQIYAETASFTHDVAGFSAKWLRDVAAEQRPNGSVTHIVPDPHPMDDHHEPIFWKDIQGSAGWGDAAVHVPWVTYLATGDRQLLEDQWASMVAWVDFGATAAATDRRRDRVVGSPEPAPHERFLWDTGFHFGEWLEPGETGPSAIAGALSKDPGPVATAFLHRSARTLGDIAAILGRDDDSALYHELAEGARSAWQAEFVDDDGRVIPESQANLVRALAFELVPDEVRPRVAARLVELIRGAGTHLTTGFLATPHLLPTLADTGHLDVAYELLLQDTEPSWLVMLERGATTVWEMWDGINAEGVPHSSLNHYSKGAVISFLHQYVAGIGILEPGYRRFQVAPRPGGGLRSASAWHDSPYGRLSSAWSIDDDVLTLTVEVPPGTSADVVLPGAAVEVLGPGRHERSQAV